MPEETVTKLDTYWFLHFSNQQFANNSTIINHIITYQSSARVVQESTGRTDLSLFAQVKMRCQLSYEAITDTFYRRVYFTLDWTLAYIFIIVQQGSACFQREGRVGHSDDNMFFS